MSFPWRNAASMIIIARNSILPSTLRANANPAFDYQMLMLRRSAKSKFMPNAYVFPGGVSSEADFDPGWKNVIQTHGSGEYETLIAPKGARRPLLMAPKAEDGLERDVAFRLCALRETFEESGLLLTCGEKRVPEEELAKWRPDVHADPTKFIRLCQEHSVCPDLWSTSEWSCWLTPLGRKDEGNRRFDTLFLTTFAERELSAATFEDKEITDVQWTDPESVVKDSLAEKMWLAPPQVFELTRFSKFKTYDGLKAACEARRPGGIDTWMPLFYICSDGFLSVLPGDELYPEVPDLHGEKPPPQKFKMTMEEVNEKYPRANRMAIYSKHNVRPFVTVKDEEMLLKR